MKGRNYQKWIFAAAVLVMAAAFGISLLVGRYTIQWGEIGGDTMSTRVFFSLRLPRTCMALLAGVGLSVAGSVYQSLFRNPLAAPDIIGASSGASAGAAAAILWLGGGAVENLPELSRRQGLDGAATLAELERLLHLPPQSEC